LGFILEFRRKRGPTSISLQFRDVSNEDKIWWTPMSRQKKEENKVDFLLSRKGHYELK
jgi:hypothetical protein